MTKFSVLIVVLLLFWATVDVSALTVIEGEGRGYPILEESQTKNIVKEYTKAKEKEKKKTPEQIEKEWIVHLKELPGVAQEDRKRIVDPRYTMPFDIKDADGNIVGNHRAGYTFNPLDKIKMTSLIVIDGTKDDQILWAKELRRYLHPAKVLLTKGSFYAVLRKYQFRVFHLSDDIMGRMQIKKAPCTVIQKGNMLEVSEYRAHHLPNPKTHERD
jgi:hypothetical protein